MVEIRRPGLGELARALDVSASIDLPNAWVALLTLGRAAPNIMGLPIAINDLLLHKV